MKIWVAYVGEYDEQYLMEFCSSKEKAEEVLEHWLTKQKYPDYLKTMSNVYETELDEYHNTHLTKLHKVLA